MRTFRAAVLAVAVAFAVVLGLGFWIHRQPQTISDDVFGWIAGISIGAIAVVIFCGLRGIAPWKTLARAATPQSPLPSRVRPNDAAQSAYRENSNATATCVHLQPVERAMRHAGLDVRLLEASEYRPAIRAACRINEGALRQAFSLPDSISYREGYEPERYAFDNPRADLVCAICLQSNRTRCDILVLHPDEWRTDTPWFPVPPAGEAR
jgi:hypothetical protein